jgi:hypothetical protein
MGGVYRKKKIIAMEAVSKPGLVEKTRRCAPHNATMHKKFRQAGSGREFLLKTVLTIQRDCFIIKPLWKVERTF